jgi:hypothetical protein
VQEADDYNRTTLGLAKYLAPDFHQYYNYQNDDTRLFAVQKDLKMEIVTGEKNDVTVEYI